MNPRRARQQVRALEALLRGPCSSRRLVEEALTVAPARLIFRLRNAGIEIATDLDHGTNAAGERCMFAVYSLTAAGRKAVRELLKGQA